MSWRIHPLVTAELDVPRPLMVWREGWGESVRVQAIAWLLENGTDAVLVDTAVGGIETRPQLPQADFPREGAIWTQIADGGIIGALSAHGLTPSDIDHVVLTHLHFDHCGNLPLFDRARIHVSSQGLDHVGRATHRLDARYPADVVDWMRRDDEAAVNRVGESATILPGIDVRHLGGHTRCSQALVADTTQGRLVMAGDVIPLFENLDDERPTGNYHFLAELIEGSRSARSWGTVLPSHDPRTPAFLADLDVAR